MLSEIADKTVLTVELGLQSVHEQTARLINRCHTYGEFCDGYQRLKQASSRINICIHLIEGLPGEDHDMMVESARQVAMLRPEQVKLHCLNVLKNTALATLYESGRYTPIERDEFVSVVCDCLELVPAETVIGRLTGDADRSKLIEPQWTTRKTEVINMVDQELYRRGSYQGMRYNGNK